MEGRLISSREAQQIVLSSIVIAFVLSFLEGIIPFTRSLIITLIALIFFTITQKVIAKKYGFHGEYQIWSLKDKKPGKTNFYSLVLHNLGIVIPILIFLFTNGLISTLTTSSFVIKKRESLTGKKFPFITELEEAKILFSGIISFIFLAIIFKILSNALPTEEAMIICLLLAIYHLIPIPNLPGSKIFFGSRTLYIFSIVLTGTMYLLLINTSLVTSLITSIISSALILLFYIYTMEAGISRPFAFGEYQGISLSWRIIYVIAFFLVLLFLSLVLEAAASTVIALAIIIATLIMLVYYYNKEIKKKD
ncbi:MAG: hypothetical protein HYS32_01675 [Candidatus Woesearchaeota archaeon]|nr:MAG: hypothetical protein HYS32_01675 [Candidatus Woesearchaeota archaeon]